MGRPVFNLFLNSRTLLFSDGSALLFVDDSTLLLVDDIALLFRHDAALLLLHHGALVDVPRGAFLHSKSRIWQLVLGNIRLDIQGGPLLLRFFDIINHLCFIQYIYINTLMK